MTRKPKEAPAPKERIVKVADWAAERGDAVIVTLGLGSCVAIMLHDANAGAGAMAHILLPSKSLARDVLRRTGIPVMREAVGGGAGRSVRFYVADGRVEIRSVGADAIVL